jgi:sterol desaturase/sphingolipid hydroxylase (fatty acid hydroxylase superfamily)
MEKPMMRSSIPDRDVEQDPGAARWAGTAAVRLDRFTKAGPTPPARGPTLTGIRAGLRGLLSIEMSPACFYLDFVVYPAVILVSLVLAFTGATVGEALLSVAMILFGYAVWTLVEYGLHRLALHHVPKLEEIHKAHHDAPRDLIGTPTLVSVVAFAGLAYWPAVELAGLRTASAWMAGLLAGYLCYTLAHHAIHNLSMGKSRWAMTLKRHHALHHYRDGKSNFGVTTRIWDRLFGTLVD